MARILVIRSGSLGDLILSLPVCQSIRKNGYLVELTCPRTCLNYFLEFGLIDGGKPLDSLEFASFFSEKAEPEQKILDYLNSFDLIFSYTSSEERFSQNLQKFVNGKIIFHPLNLEELSVHIIDYLLEPCRKYFSYMETIPEIKLPKKAEYIILHPGSGSQNKNWFRENYREVFSRLARRRKFFHSGHTAEGLTQKGEKVLVILGPAEENQVGYWQQAVPSKNLLISPDLKELTETLLKAKLYLGNDSGTTHLASALGLNTIAIFGPTDPAIWSPRGGKVSVIYKKINCSPCSSEQRGNCSRKKCLEIISSDEVIDEIVTVENQQAYETAGLT